MKDVYRYLLLGLFVVLLGFAARPAAAQYNEVNDLRVLDPRQMWWDDQGTIEEAVVSVRPRGVYMEYDLYLTFSARDTYFETEAPVEVEFFFTLPEEAVVTDSWLWIGDDIIRAEMLDMWTASDIYEDIVDRQRDPSILFKRDASQYELRVYPMDPDSTRRVKLSYLLPARWTGQYVQAPLPTHLLQTSKHPLEEVTVLTRPGDEWQDPVLLEDPSLSFQQEVGEDGAVQARLTLPGSAANGPLTLAYPSPLQDQGADMYVSRHPGEGAEGWYQLALRPFDVGEVEQNVLFLVDYESANTNRNSYSILTAMHSLVRTHLTTADSFNVMLGRLNVERAADDWLPAGAAVVDSTFERLGPQMGDYSNLPTLLREGLAFIEEQGSGGSVILISSSDQFGDVTAANSLLEDIQEVVETLPPFHILDVTTNFDSYWIGGRRYYGNEYLFTNLAKLTAGSYTHVRDGLGVNEAMEETYGALSSRTGTMDLHTTLSSGFCYGRYTLGGASSGTMASGEYVLQLGRYYGDFPFVAELSGLVDEEPLSKRVERSLDETAEADSTLATLWTGLRIQDLEGGVQTNDVISDIIGYSLKERILSLYTAFLALEEQQGGEVCATCRDEAEDGGGATTGRESEEATATEVQLDVYPNPFSAHATIVLVLTAPAEAAEVSFEVYDVMGRLVRTLQPNQGGPARRFELTWHGDDAAGSRLAAGTYLLVVTTPEGRYTRGLTLVR